ncbi:MULTISPECIES: hypothetical protein [Cyanophyceae]|uniref:hypothetical protein n=1 Tax=Cyanophyceae TaxID=3028117 RepID=UPI0002F77C47|nr:MULTISPECIES: hypothetical protein [Cyanophyceae]SMH33731.1 hypothetical protein SAMN06272755_0490 [Picosynechococcus sp. OG1]SMQ84456.1 hypothetical protein SAMN06272774_2866 [Synechococcus sp. 7002]
MRHLAQIQRHPQSTQLQLVFVAQEQPDGSWLIHDQGDRPSMVYSQTEFAVGALVLIQLDKQRQLASIQDATDWLLNVVHHYFVPGKITPEFVQQEQKKIETWRQEMTAQSQDFTRRQLELEVRREQLEALEQKLSDS